jgi:FMN phosphatase YigB (HAD superfamily)
VEKLRHRRGTAYVVFGDIGRVAGKEVVVFDIDGVLIDNSERYRMALREVSDKVVSHTELRGVDRTRFWEVFLSPKYLHLDRPVEKALELLRARKREGYPIVIITGRTDNIARHTLAQLKRFGVEYDVAVFRRKGHFVEDAKFKALVVRELGLKVVEWHEDIPDIVAVALKLVKKGVYHWYRPGEYRYIDASPYRK